VRFGFLHRLSFTHTVIFYQDAARFGSNYLSKFGWDASKGLGASGDGMKSHIKVSHKLDMLGIGAAQTKDPNGIAWKQNRDFENLLQRLNEKLEVEQKPAADKTEESTAENNVDSENGEKKKKKRKHKETEEEDGSERKKKKKHGKDKKEGGEDEPGSKAEAMQVDMETKTTVEVQKVVALPRHRAYVFLF
jgi:Pin2-interacting protein X1